MSGSGTATTVSLGSVTWPILRRAGYPAEPAGGIKALRALAGPFPQIRFCPTGGIGETNAPQWLAEPNVIAVGGSRLCQAVDIKSGNWAGITAMCERTVKSAKAA